MNPTRIACCLLTLLALAAGGPAAAQLAECNADPAPGCLYAPAAYYAVEHAESVVTYNDVAGEERHVPIAIRRPLGARAPLPVVVWSPGGATGHHDPSRSLAEWSEATAQAGYLTVSVAHVPRDEDPATPDGSRRSLCEAVARAAPGTLWDLSDPATCLQFKYLNWDRPHDLRAVLDELERMNRAGPLAGRIDLARIAVGGHSAGAGGALTVGGALRNFTGTIVDLSDPRRRPAAFIALSPQQQGNEGFFDTDHDRPLHSWSRIRRPVLMVTGDGDSTCNPLGEPGSCFGDTPYGRRTGFGRMPAGGKYLLYLHDARIFHSLFGLETRARPCTVSPDAQSRCDETAQVLRATALAFLDWHLQALPLARQWLQGRDVELTTGAAAQWQRR
jgi:predicted dienelactone hydrolase